MAPLRGIPPPGEWKAWQVALMVGVPVSVVGGVYMYRRYKKNCLPSISNVPPKPEDEAKKFKTQGNEHFKAGRYPSAIDCYSKAIELAESVSKEELSTFYQNRAAAYDQLNNYLMVVKDCTTAISLNSRYIKALSRRARAYHTTGFLNEALEDVTAACVLEGFSVTKNVQLADVIIKEICNRKADEKMKVRAPKEPSSNQVTRFLAGFTSDPVFNSPEYHSVSKATTPPHSSPFNRSYKRALLSFMNQDYSNVVELCDEEINKSDDADDDAKNGDGDDTKNDDGDDDDTDNKDDNDDGDEGFTSNKVYKNKQNSDSGLVEGGGKEEEEVVVVGVSAVSGVSNGGGVGGVEEEEGEVLVNGGGGEKEKEEDEEEDDGIDIKEEGEMNNNNDDDDDEASNHDIPSATSLTSDLPTPSSTTSTTTTTPTATPAATPAVAASAARRSYGHEAQLLKGTYLCMCGDYAKALQAFDSIIQNDGISKELKSNTYLKRAKVHTSEDRPSEALSDYALAERADPCNPDVFMQRGQFHLVNERLDEAVRDFERCIQLQQQSPEPYIHKTFTESRRALMAGNVGAMPDLLKAFKEIISRFPAYSEAHVLYGQLLQDMQQFDEADDSYQKAVKLDSNCSNAYVHRGVLKITWRNDLEGGLELLRRAVLVDPCNAFAYQALGTILFQKGDIDDAVENINKAIQNVSSKAEMAHLYTILEAAQVQTKVASKLGVNLSPPL